MTVVAKAELAQSYIAQEKALLRVLVCMRSSWFLSYNGRNQSRPSVFYKRVVLWNVHQPGLMHETGGKLI
ncbi:MAG: hypothetical protein QGI25_04520, partial [Arenicellales bacterium]|jgi:hypothetical protein|nr:hypothetical protein [Arenicellales bacterium]